MTTERLYRVYEFGPFRLEEQERRLLCDGETVTLRPKLFDTLLLMVKNAGHLLERQQILEEIWPGTVVEESNLTHNVSLLRRCLSGPDTEDAYIETVPRRGYRFVAQVSVCDADPVAGVEEEAPEAGISTPPGATAFGPSIAVLPFVNLSSDPEQEFFCDGMAEDVIDALTKLEGLHVVARTSSFQFKSKNADAREVGEKLGVSTLLEGSVRRVGDRLRISAQLIQASNGYHLWSRTYDRVLSDVFAIQNEIASAIVERLKGKLLGSPLPLVKQPDVPMEVYNLFIEARFHFAAETREGIERAIALLEQAVEREPRYASAWASLARCYPTLSGYGLMPIEEARVHAERAAARALALDDTLSDALLAAGTIRSWLYLDWRGAERYYRRALELNPGSAEAHHVLSTTFLAPLGRMKESEIVARRALDLDPLAPMRSRVLAQVLFWSRQFGAAVDQLHHTLELDPRYPLTRQLLAAVYTSMRLPAEAVAERQQALHLAGRSEEAETVGAIYDRDGEPGVFRWQLDRALKRAQVGKGSPYTLALLTSILGQVEEGLHWLERAIDQKGDLVVYAKVHPWFDSLRDEPRFDLLIDRLGVNDPEISQPANV